MFYHATAHRPDSVTAALRTCFTGPDDTNLVVCKVNHLELYLLVDYDVEKVDSAGDVSVVHEKSLRLIVDIPIYGRVASIRSFRPENRKTDLLFVSTEKYKMFVLSFDPETQKLVTEATGDIRDPMARPAESGQVGLVDPGNRLLGLHISQGTFKVVPMYHSKIPQSNWNSLFNLHGTSSAATPTTGRTTNAGHSNTGGSSSSSKGRVVARAPVPGEFGEAFNVRLDELLVQSLALLHTPEDAHATLAILYQDAKELRHLVQYDIVIAEKKMVQRAQPVRIEAGATMLIPVPIQSGGGVIVVGRCSISLHSPKNNKTLHVPIKYTLINCFEQVDEAGSRYLFGDFEGRLYSLFIIMSHSKPTDLKVEFLGQTAQSTCLAYLNDSYVFVGSHYGDSELYYLRANVLPSECLVLKETFPNLSPITDFCLIDVEKQGQEQIVACSGGQRDGSLRIIRSGIGVEEIGQLDDIGELTGVWSLRSQYAVRYDNLLVLSFIEETRLQSLDGDALAEVEATVGFRTTERTLVCQNVPGDFFVQVTPIGAFLIACEGWVSLSEWKPSAGLTITHASIYHNQVAIALGGKSIVLLEVVAGALTLKTTVQLENEVSCLYVNKIAHLGVTLCAVGCWGDNSVRLLTVPDLREVYQEKLPGEIISRSILLVEFDAVPYLLVSLGDGQLFNFHISKTLILTDRKKITLGTQPFALRTFHIGGRMHVFAASDRPTVIHANSGQLLYSNVNMREVSQVSSFNSAMAEDALVFACGGALKIGTIEAVQKLHTKSIKTGESARRIAYNEASGTFATLSIHERMNSGVGSVEMYHLRIRDVQSYDLLYSFELEMYENASSLCVVEFPGDPTPYYIVGSGFVYMHEDEPSRGRILVFAVTESRQLRLVHEYEVHGSVYSFVMVEGKLLAGVNSRVMVFGWNPDATVLELETTNHGHVLALCLAARGNIVVVGDMIKSLTMLKYNNQTRLLEELGRDFDNRWTTAAEMIDDDVCIGADNNYNIFALRKQHDAESEEEQLRLLPIMLFHTGESINKMRRGSLTMRMPDQTCPATPELVYSTVSGAIGVIATLDEPTFTILETMQEVMRRVVQGVGGLSHAEWRNFHADFHQSDDVGVIDGDLIESFLDLPRAQQEQVVTRIAKQSPISLFDLTKLVEDLSRIH